MADEIIIKCDDLVFEYGKNTAKNSEGSTDDSSSRQVIRALDGVSFTVSKGRSWILHHGKHCS